MLAHCGGMRATSNDRSVLTLLLVAAGIPSCRCCCSCDASEELSTKLAVAIAPDSWRPSSELQTDDYQVAAISEVWQKTGWIRVDSQARPGYRMRLVVSAHSCLTAPDPNFK